MPDQTGKLSDAEVAQVTTYISGKFPEGLVCPACKSSDWNLEPHTVTPLTVASRGINIMGNITVYPQVVFLCKVCGHTMLFNALAVGLFPEEKKKEEALRATEGKDGK